MRFSAKWGLILIGAILLLVLSGAVIAGNTGGIDKDKEYNTLAAEDYFEAESVEDILETASEGVTDAVSIDETVTEEIATEEIATEEAATEQIGEAVTEEVVETETGDTSSVEISYRLKETDSDWTAWIINGADMMLPNMTEALEIEVSEEGLEVMIAVYDSLKGWSSWSLGSYTYTGEESVSAIKMELTGETADNYDIYYAVFTGLEVWTDWVSNGEVASDLSGEAIQGIRIYIAEREAENEDITENEEETEAQTEVVEETTEAVIETEAVEVTTEVTEEVTEAAEATTEATEEITEAVEATTEEADIIIETDAAVEETESVTDELETEAPVKAAVEDVYEGTFHVKTEEDESDIILVEKEGASYFDLTQSVLKPVCAVYDFPNTHINVGNIMTDMISIAATQVGYHRNENTNTKYGVWYGYPSSAWCAMFVSWCADQASVDKDIIKPFCRCATEATWFKGQDKWEKPAGYTPVEGDIIFFNYNGSTINHVGIVTGTKDGYVYCIEGNHADSVDITRHKLTASYITGYGTPDYEVEEEALIKYSAHLRTLGWADYVLEGAMAGTTGESRRMEAVMIAINDDVDLDGGVSYRVHVRSYGWMPWVSDGAVAGTTGEARRMEAIEVVLTGEMAELYDVYYRVHVESYGWLDWAKNGEMAGTSGMYKRMEAIEVVLVEKDGEAPGSTEVPYYVDGESAIDTELSLTSE